MIHPLLNKDRSKQLGLFFVSGTLCAFVDIGLLVFLKETLHVETIAAASISFTSATCVNYVFNARWVFPMQGKQYTKRSFVLFCLVSLLSLGLNNVIIAFFTHRLHISYLIAKLVAVVLILGWTFVARKYLIFKSTQR